MNIFLLDYDVVKCAEYHCDKHVVKMILEYAQLLSTAVRHYGVDAGYKATHINHPCAKWARASQANWIWLRCLALCLCTEYTFRYNKIHKTANVIESLYLPITMPKGVLNLRKIPQCMPEEYKHPDPVEAYRTYYMREKFEMLSWKTRGEPEWANPNWRPISRQPLPS